MNLDSLALIQDCSSHRSSSWDRSGGNIDSITDMAPGSTTLLLETDGPGKVTHIWMTMAEYEGHDTAFRDMVLRMYWDGSSIPSVEAPLGDFFGLGHSLPAGFYQERHFEVTAAPVTVGANPRALNCYFPMPFHRSARIELYNNGARSIRQLYFHVDHELGPQQANAGLFHAHFRQEKELATQEWMNLDGKENYVLLETEGRGQYVGCFFYVDSAPGAWWGEGDDMIFIDHAAMPTLNGTGSEDYFGNAWGYDRAFSYPYYGCPLLGQRPDGGSWTTLYRFHVADPVRFQDHIRVTVEHIFYGEATNSYSSVAFWYQELPIRQREPLPAGAANHARTPAPPHEHPRTSPAEQIIAAPMLEAALRAQGETVRTHYFLGQERLIPGGSLIITCGGREIKMAVPVEEGGFYSVEAKPVYGLMQDPVTFRLADGQEEITYPNEAPREDSGPYVNLGRARAEAGFIRLTVQAPGEAPVHRFRLKHLGYHG